MRERLRPCGGPCGGRARLRYVAAGSVVRVAPETVLAFENEGHQPIEVWAVWCRIGHEDSTRVDAFLGPRRGPAQRRDPG